MNLFTIDRPRPFRRAANRHKTLDLAPALTATSGRLCEHVAILRREFAEQGRQEQTAQLPETRTPGTGDWGRQEMVMQSLITSTAKK
jgi:hypothetical protein